MNWLNLSGNRFEDADTRILSKCIHNIDGLKLEQCGITEEGVNALTKQIKTRNTPVY